MRRIALFLLLLLAMASSLQAQEIDDVELMLQYVIDRPEMDQILAEFAIDQQLDVLRTPVLPQQLELNKFGKEVAIVTPEGAFFRNKGYVAFTGISTSGPSTVTVEAQVEGSTSQAREGVTVSFVLTQHEGSWRLERFNRAQ